MQLQVFKTCARSLAWDGWGDVGALPPTNGLLPRRTKKEIAVGDMGQSSKKGGGKRGSRIAGRRRNWCCHRRCRERKLPCEDTFFSAFPEKQEEEQDIEREEEEEGCGQKVQTAFNIDDTLPFLSSSA